MKEHPQQNAETPNGAASELSDVLGLRFEQQRDVVLAGFNRSHVDSCCQGRSKSHKGFRWRKIPKIDLDTPTQPEV